MKKVFLSMPMKGRSKEYLDKIFNKVEEYANQNGYKLIKSIIADSEKSKNEPVWYLGESIKLLSGADEVWFEKDYKYARGCRIEYAVCEEYGIEKKLLSIDNDSQISVSAIL